MYFSDAHEVLFTYFLKFFQRYLFGILKCNGCLLDKVSFGELPCNKRKKDYFQILNFES